MRGSSYCSTVEAGRVANANRTAALPCPAGTFSTTGAAECTRCDAAAGFHSPSNASATCTRCSPALFLVSSANATACVCAETFVAAGQQEEGSSASSDEGCTCGEDEYHDELQGRCTPCRGGFAKPELGLESALCIYDKGNTLPLLVGAACAVLLAVGVAAFALRKNEGGLLGSL